MSIEEIFSDVLLDHYQHPRKSGNLSEYDYRIEGANPLCGDEIELQVKLDQDQQKVEDIAFKGKSCAICTASTSMFCEKAQGREIEDIKELKSQIHKLLEGKILTKEEKLNLGDILALEGVSKLPVRVKCALLVYETWDRLKNSD